MSGHLEPNQFVVSELARSSSLAISSIWQGERVATRSGSHQRDWETENVEFSQVALEKVPASVPNQLVACR